MRLLAISLSFVTIVQAFAMAVLTDHPTAPDWPENGRPPSRSQLVAEAAIQLQSIINSPSMDDCAKCIAGLEVGKFLALTTPEIVPEVLSKFCEDQFSTNALAKKRCKHQFGRSVVKSPDSRGGTTDDGTSDITNVLRLINPAGVDGQYICHYQVSNACPLPAVPDYDLSSWWPVKPSDAVAPPPSEERFNVIHVSDFHIDLDFKVGSESNCSQYMCCNSKNFHESSPQAILSPAHEYGGYQCDIPDSLLQNSLESMAQKTVEKNFEFAIFTGDMVDHDETFEALTLESAIDSETVIYRSMKNHLKDIPVYATLGNHDTFPYGQTAQNRSGYANKFDWNTDLAYNMWTEYGWLSQMEAQQAREHYAAFAVTTKRGLRVISLNSNFWLPSNYYNYWSMDDPDTSGMLRFLSDQLLECEEKGTRAWIIAHVPTGGNGDTALPTGAEVFNQIVERFSPHVVAGVFFGHTHKDEFQVQYANNSTLKSAQTALSVAFLAPSITPFVNYNPGWRYYEVDAKTFSVMESHNYYLRLNETFVEEPQQPEWIYEYSARDEYDPQHNWPSNAPLNATFWHYAAENILISKDIRQRYLRNSFRRSPYVPECESRKCIHNLYCYLTTSSVSLAIKCQNEFVKKHHSISINSISIASKLLFIGSGLSLLALIAYGGYRLFIHARKVRAGYVKTENNY